MTHPFSIVQVMERSYKPMLCNFELEQRAAHCILLSGHPKHTRSQTDHKRKAQAQPKEHVFNKRATKTWGTGEAFQAWGGTFIMEHILNLLETLAPISSTMGINVGEIVKARERHNRHWRINRFSKVRIRDFSR